MPPKKATDSDKSAAAKPKTPPKAAKKLSSKRIVLPEDTLAVDAGALAQPTSESISLPEGTVEQLSSEGPAPPLPAAEPEQQAASASEQPAPQPDLASTDTQAGAEQEQGPADNADVLDPPGGAVTTPAELAIVSNTVDEALLAKDQGAAAAPLTDTESAAVGSEPASAPITDLTDLPPEALLTDTTGLTNPVQADAEAAVSYAAVEPGANTAASDMSSQPQAVEDMSESTAEQVSIAAAMKQELARQAQLKVAHAELEWRLRQFFSQRGSVPPAAKDNMHMATQATRYTSLLSAWQSRASDKAAVVQAHAAQMASLAPLIEKRQEAVAQLQADFRVMVEAAGQLAISSKTGHAMGGKVVQQALATLQAKQQDLRLAQVAFLQTQAWLKAIQARVTAQESFSGGLGLMDLEQLQLEKAGLVIKLAARDHEMAKFLQKRRDVVQILAHVKCKLYQQRKVHQALEAEVASATGVLNHHRAVAAAAKLSAQQASEKAARERENDTTLHDIRLVEHYQTQLLHREHLQQKMLEVSGKLSRTLLSISPNNILPPDSMLIPAKMTQRTLAALQAEIEGPMAVEHGYTEETFAV